MLKLINKFLVVFIQIYLNKTKIHFYSSQNEIKGIIIKSMKAFLLCAGALIIIPIVFLIMLYFGWIAF